MCFEKIVGCGQSIIETKETTGFQKWSRAVKLVSHDSCDTKNQAEYFHSPVDTTRDRALVR